MELLFKIQVPYLVDQNAYSPATSIQELKDTLNKYSKNYSNLEVESVKSSDNGLVIFRVVGKNIAILQHQKSESED